MPSEVQRSYGRLFWLCVLAGWAVMAYAVAGLFDHRSETHPASVARLVIGLNLVHDLVVAPLVLITGLLVLRVVPVRVRPPVKAALAISAVVALYAYPLVRGYGRSAAAGPSRLPNDYASGLGWTLLTVWLAVAAVAGVAAARRARA